MRGMRDANATPTSRCWSTPVWRLAFGFRCGDLRLAKNRGASLSASVQTQSGFYGFTASAIQVYLTRRNHVARVFLHVEVVEARAQHAWDHIQSPQYVKEVGKRTASQIRNIQHSIDAEQQRRLRIKEQS